jgi:hypothetical protein
MLSPKRCGIPLLRRCPASTGLRTAGVRPALGEKTVLDQDQGRWLTYAEAGQQLGISPEAVRQLARRRGWPRRTPNAYGIPTKVLVPDDAPVRPRPGVDAGQPPYERGTAGDGDGRAR